MAWNEPGGNKDKDPWGNNNDQGPPDLDEAFRNLTNNVTSLFGGKRRGGSGGGGAPRLNASMFAIAAVVLGLIWGFFGLYTVDQGERAVVLRFGKKIDEIIQPGLHWNPPLIDTVYQVNVTQVRSLSHDAEMLTQDENIVRVSMSVQFKIGDVRDFVLNVKDPIGSLEQATESALRHVVGSSNMHDVLTEGRAGVAIDVGDRIQQYMERYGTGILVEQVNINDTQPPEAVKAAFDDVIKAREDEVRLVNEADAYANQIVPEARGEARSQIEEAEGYKQQVIARATGEAARFNRLYAEYKLAPVVTRERLYLDTIESVMQNSTKVLIDVAGGNNMLYLPLDKIVQQAPASGSSFGGQLNEQIQEAVTRELNRRGSASPRSSRR